MTEWVFASWKQVYDALTPSEGYVGTKETEDDFCEGRCQKMDINKKNIEITIECMTLSEVKNFKY